MAKIYALGKIQFVIDAAPHDDVPITAAKNGATGSNDAINRARAGNLVGHFHRKFRFMNRRSRGAFSTRSEASEDERRRRHRFHQ